MDVATPRLARDPEQAELPAQGVQDLLKRDLELGVGEVGDQPEGPSPGVVDPPCQLVGTTVFFPSPAPVDA